VTCRTCLTLNPPGPPACVRCNTPLEAAPAGPDPTVGSKQIGPGLAASDRAAPGSSRAAAAAVQPPGYGDPEPAVPPAPGPAPEPAPGQAPGQAPGPAPEPAPEPARDARRDSRRITVAGLALVALVLAGGGGALWLTRPSYLDTAAVAGAVAGELTARLGGPVSVTCPDGVRSRAGETFACTARDATGTSRRVTVTLLDDAGRYRWELGGR
jgi:hypothetical protein